MVVAASVGMLFAIWQGRQFGKKNLRMRWRFIFQQDSNLSKSSRATMKLFCSRNGPVKVQTLIRSRTCGKTWKANVFYPICLSLKYFGKKMKEVQSCQNKSRKTWFFQILTQKNRTRRKVTIFIILSERNVIFFIPIYNYT